MLVWLVGDLCGRIAKGVGFVWVFVGFEDRVVVVEML